MMHRVFKSLPRATFALLAAVSILMFAGIACASGPLEKVLHTFTGQPDGAGPVSGLVADHAGNLFGTTKYGGTETCTGGEFAGCGTVFELTPPTVAGGAWTETVIHSFGGLNDGIYPTAPLFIDGLGNLYGTTDAGGGKQNVGTVFEVSPPVTSGDAWTETVIFKFDTDYGPVRGYPPFGRVTVAAGNIYGTAQNGGWEDIILYNFGSNSGDGAFPVGNLLFDRTGAIYGTTTGSPGETAGTIFQLTGERRSWTLRTIFTFGSNVDGISPHGLIFDNAGNLYGTTSSGGVGSEGGVVFEVTPPATSGDPWTEAVLYTFVGGKDGATPDAGLALDKAGNLYGTAFNGGLNNHSTNNNGTVFELSPPAVPGGTWTETTLHEFGGPTYNDGNSPTGGIVFSKGKLFGATANYTGAAPGLGGVFSVAFAP